MQAGIGAVVAADDHTRWAPPSRGRSTWEAILGPRGGRGRARGKVVHRLLPQGRRRQDHVGRQPRRSRWRDAGIEVCVVDLDLAFGDVAITLQLIPEHTIADAAESEEHLDFSLLADAAHPPPSGLTILAAPTHPEGRDRITASLVRRVIQTLRRHFDYVVIDTPPGFDDQVLGAFDETDECIIVATLDVPTIKNTKVALETLDLLNLVRNNRHLVLNRADEEVGPVAGERRGDPQHEGRGRPAERHRGRQCHQPRPARSCCPSPTTRSPRRIVEPRQRARRRAASAKPAEPAKRGLFGRKK